MSRTRIAFLLFITLTACSPAPVPPTPTSTLSKAPPQSTATLPPELTVTEVPIDTPAPTTASNLEPTPDFSAVTIYEATHLMDPNFFQISLEAWPQELPEGVILQLSGIDYSCEILFPEEFPGRLYCWGPAPAQGTRALIEVFLPEGSEPIFRAGFVVPRP